MPDMEQTKNSSEAAAGKPVPQAVWEYTLQEEEIYQGLRRSSVRKAGPVSDWVRTIILAVVEVGCIMAGIIDREQAAGSLLIGAVALALIAVIWITPPLRCRHVARQMAEGGTDIVVCMFENGLSFGGPEEDIYAYAGFYSRVFEDMVICELPGYQLILIPHRAVKEEAQWQTLTSRLKAASGNKG